MYDCPSPHFFDLLIMIKLPGVWWLAVAQSRVPWVLYYTASHLGPEKKTTKRRCKDNRGGLKTVRPHGGNKLEENLPLPSLLQPPQWILMTKISNDSWNLGDWQINPELSFLLNAGFYVVARNICWVNCMLLHLRNICSVTAIAAPECRCEPLAWTAPVLTLKYTVSYVLFTLLQYFIHLTDHFMFTLF